MTTFTINESNYEALISFYSKKIADAENKKSEEEAWGVDTYATELELSRLHSAIDKLQLYKKFHEGPTRYAFG